MGIGAQEVLLPKIVSKLTDDFTCQIIFVGEFLGIQACFLTAKSWFCL